MDQHDGRGEDDGDEPLDRDLFIEAFKTFIGCLGICTALWVLMTLATEVL
jgi:hypothetical protein